MLREFLRTAYVVALCLGVALVASPAEAVVLDFDHLPAGTILDLTYFPPGTTLVVDNAHPTRPDEAIIFDSSCPGGCTGGDDDLRTPGAGAGNTTALGMVMIIAEDVVDSNNDGLVDDPDDENDGGYIELQFMIPQKLYSVRALDFEPAETPSQIELTLVGGGNDVVPFSLLGDNSQETVLISNPQAASVIRFVYGSTGALDQLELVTACGDNILDPGEQCDPPGSQGGSPSCSDTCQIMGPVCGDDTVELPEECDPPATAGGDADCREDCTRTICGDGLTEGPEECDPPASHQGGDPLCREDCTLIRCGDSIQDPGEDCDPPASQGGDPLCDDNCQLDPGPECGDNNLDPGETCDPPASQGGVPECNDNCLLSICGDTMVEVAEECDPPASQGGSHLCNDDCQLSVCGDGEIEAGEDCEPPASQGGDPFCNDDCTTSQCGDDETEAGEECDPPFSEGGDPTCDDNCMLIPLPECGDGIIEPPDEECDPPTADGGVPMCNADCTLSVCGDGEVGEGEECDPPFTQGGSTLCEDNCTLGVCGDGNIDPGEECDPQGGEICNNMIDDDADGMVDCQDDDCVDLEKFCDGECIEVPGICKPILDDPAFVKFKKRPKLDIFSIHGRVQLDPPFAGGTLDPTTNDFTLTLRNLNGLIYSGTVPAGQLIQKDKHRYAFKDKAAKFGMGNSDGVFRVINRFRLFNNVWFYTTRFKAYSDFANGVETPADQALMWTQLYGVEGPGYLKATWNQKKNGSWILKRKDFAPESMTLEKR